MGALYPQTTCLKLPGHSRLMDGNMSAHGRPRPRPFPSVLMPPSLEILLSGQTSYWRKGMYTDYR
jgi:hypothetical protein